MLTLVAALCAPALVVAQPEARTKFVFHMYVDPIHGDDRLAGNQSHLFNPEPFSAKEPLSDHPKDASWTTLQHAPFSFRTVTATVNWIVAKRFVPPYSPPASTKRVEYIVIHCLPGLYGPILEGTKEIDPTSGLPWNGEIFPIQLPERVCIQGTSALDTIFDARERYASVIFQLGFNASGEPEQWSKTFIDGITLRGARGTDSQYTAPAGAAVVIWWVGIRPIISNCILTNNTVGIAIDGPSWDSPPEAVVNSPVIVNNTFAWNKIGIWSGSLLDPASHWPTVGRSLPRLLNNVFDSDDALGKWGGDTNTSGFEGIDASDLKVASIASNPVNVDFNAYEANHVNRGIVPVGWSPTTPRTAAPLVPRVDIDPYTRASSPAPRGILFIRDVFVQALGAAPLRQRHDLRLAPVAYSDGQATINPLVNKGTDTRLGALHFANFKNAAETPDITRPPGLQGPGDQSGGNDTQYAAIHCWDWDLEGYGNSRWFPRPGFPAPPQHSTDIDLGADEMGNLIVAGFIDSTRIFSRLVPDGAGNTLPIPDHTKIYFFDLPGSYPRPFFSWFIGGRIDSGVDYLWWKWAQETSTAMFPFVDGPVTTHYTVGQLPMYRTYLKAWVYPAGTPPWEPFMRNLECDLAPHLIADFHPFWATAFNTFTPATPLDEFGSNPWHHHSTVPPNATEYDRADNHYLYYKPTHPQKPSAVFEGHVNPPGTWLHAAPYGYIGWFPTAVFNPSRPPGTTSYTVNASGYGDVPPGPDIVPDSAWLGVRYNLEYPMATNLQTFLGINGVPPLGSDEKLVGSSWIPPALTSAPRAASLEDSLRAVRSLRFR